MVLILLYARKTDSRKMHAYRQVIASESKQNTIPLRLKRAQNDGSEPQVFTVLNAQRAGGL